MTNQTIDNYGYIMNPPDWKEWDECRSHNRGSFTKCEYQFCKNERRRPIQPGEGYRILGLDEQCYKFHIQITKDGTTWTKADNYPLGMESVKSMIERVSIAGVTILAIRVPIKQEQEKGGDVNATSALPGATKASEVTNEAKEIMTMTQELNHLTQELKRLSEWEKTQLPAQKPHYSGEWISVKDEMPNNNYVTDYTVMVDGRTQAVQGRFNPDYKLPWTNGTITHWYRLYPQAPLPEMDKEPDMFEEWWNSPNGYSETASPLNKEFYKRGWHAALNTQKGKVE